MQYSIVFDEDSINYLNILPKDIAKRVYNKIISTKINPFYFFKKLEGRRGYKLRVGNYRVIADINVTELKIEITCIGHRKNVYKK